MSLRRVLASPFLWLALSCGDAAPPPAAGPPSFACDVQIVDERARIVCSNGTWIMPPRGVACTGTYTTIDCDDGTRILVRGETAHVQIGVNATRCADESGQDGQRFTCDDGTTGLLAGSDPGACTTSAEPGAETLSCGTTTLRHASPVVRGPEDVVACDADLLPTRSCRRDGADGCFMLPEIARHLNASGEAREETTPTDAQARDSAYDLRIAFRVEVRSRVDLVSRRAGADVTTTCLSATCDGDCLAQTSPETPNEELATSAELAPGVYYLRVRWTGVASWSWSVAPVGG